MAYLMNGLTSSLTAMGLNADFVPALPTAIMKPLSGSGARGMMVSTMETYGVTSFPGRLACVFQGAADTTFYILTVYFGYVGVKNTRYALKTCLIADIAGAIAAIWVAYLFFH
jgi:spore maturation protein SpmB